MSTEAPGARGFYFFASICAGAAIGLVAYRFGMLPFAWQAKGSMLIPGVAAGLGFAAGAIVKDRGPRPGLPILIAGGVLGAALTFGLSYLVFPTLSRASLTTTELPGFSIGLPSGDAPTQRIFEYDVGTYQLRNVAGKGGVLVTWEGGEPSTEDLEVAATVLGPTVGATGVPTLLTLTGPRGTAVESVRIDGDKGPMLMSFIPCGTRRVMIMTMLGSDTTTMHERVLQTLTCKPDPARESIAPGLVPLIAELPGWFATERDPGQVVLSDGRGLILLKTLSASTGGLKLVVPMLNAFGWKLAITGEKGDRILVSGTIEGEAVHGWVRSVPCVTQAVVIVAIAMTLDGADALATQLASARCARPPETGTAWQDAPAGFLDEATDEAAGSATP